MDSDLLGDRELLAYLAGVIALSAVTILLLLALFIYRVPSFTLAFAENPVHAIQEYPLAVLLVLGTVLSSLLLISLVVVFGARYGLQEPAESELAEQRE